MSLWTLSALAEAAAGRLAGAAPATPVTGVSIDTRTLRRGDVFFAIRGVRMDGHAFVGDALAARAAAAVIDHGDGERAIVVGDTQRALEGVGAAARARLAPGTPVVAVTGSVGKTGTKEMLRLAFGDGAHASSASHNNLWGVPLTLARMPAEATAGVFEIGMNHAGEITPLTRLVRPTIAIVTTVAAVHLEFFDSVEGIADAKAEIFLGLRPGGTALVPGDIGHAPRLRRAAEAAGAAIVTFAGDGADVRLLAYDRGTGEARAAAFGEEVRFTVAGGEHHARNALAVLGALRAAGRPLGAIAALSAWQPARGRGRRVHLAVKGGEAVLLDEAYNANPASMGAAIRALGAVPATRRIAVLGDMLELGETSAELHRGLAPLLVEAGVRIVHTVGAMMEHLSERLPRAMRGRHAADAAALAADLPALAAGDAVLVKGSNALGLSRIVDAIEERHGGARADA